MSFKILIVVNLMAVLLSLLLGGVFLSRDGQNSKRVVTALTVRISLSVCLLVLVIVAHNFGLIHPNSSPYMFNKNTGEQQTLGQQGTRP